MQMSNTFKVLDILYQNDINRRFILKQVLNDYFKTPPKSSPKGGLYILFLPWEVRRCTELVEVWGFFTSASMEMNTETSSEG